MAEKEKPEEPYTGSVVGFLEEAADDNAVESNVRKSSSISAEERKHVKATPMVRMLAKKLNVDIISLKGTGPEGRVTKEDVGRAAKQ